MIIGARAMRGEAISPNTAEEDVKYVMPFPRARRPAATSCRRSCDDINIAYLTIGGIARAAASRIWPLNRHPRFKRSVARPQPTVWCGWRHIRNRPRPIRTSDRCVRLRRGVV